MQGVPHGFKAEGDNLPARCGSWLANSMVVSASDRNRASPKARYASLRNISFTDSWHISLSSGKLSFTAAGFVGDALAERHPADRFVLHRVAHAPVDIAVPDIARVLFRALLVRISPAIIVRTGRSLIARYSSLSNSSLVAK